MPIMLPATSPSARSIVGVADDLLAVLTGENSSYPSVRSVVLIVVDGLGAGALRTHAGHARFLAGQMTKKDVAYSVLPSTTASALTSIVTGSWPGRHGLVGYQVRHPETGKLINQLTDWEEAGVNPDHWQSSPTIFERAAELGRPTFALGLPAFANTGFTRAILRGAQFIGVAAAESRIEQAYALAAKHEGALVYCYLSELDKAGHKYGIASTQWTRALEDIDFALQQRIPTGVGVMVTSDHGMVDVSADRQITVSETDPCMTGVTQVGGEPRMLHIYLEDPAEGRACADRWREAVGFAADVSTKQEAIDAGLFGPLVTEDAASRIGDVLVASRGNYACYIGNGAQGRGMIGQHGSVTLEELQVPMIGLGAFSRS